MKKWKPLAERGDATSQFQVGWLYFEGKGVTQNYSTAVKWYRLAAEQGFAYAQSALGLMYSNGTGISQDYTRTYMWFSIAASLWDTNAGAMRDAVAKKMSSTQLETARILIRECVQKNFKGC
jgi:TPR repeat protein